MIRVDFERLSTVLWRERQLLDLLLFKAEEKQYVLVTGKNQWLPMIAASIEDTLTQLRLLEVERAALTEDLAAGLGLGENPSLRQLAQVAPEPWADLLMRHYEALLGTVTSIRALSEANRDLADAGLRVLNDAIQSAQAPSAGTYTATGRPEADTHRAVTLDGTL